MKERYLHDIIIAVEAILSNKLKSILTALGIIFGVAAVISMLAIGNGAQQEILEQMKQVGVNNIVIIPKKQEKKEDGEETKIKGKFSTGLNLKDAEAIRKIVPTAKQVSPEILKSTYLVINGKGKNAKLFGITNNYFDLLNLNLSEGGRFNSYQENHGLPVCIIGAEIKTKFFSNSNPIGKKIKCGKIWLKIVGIIERKKINNSEIEGVKLTNQNDKVYIPLKTMLMRFENRALYKKANQGNRFNNENNTNKVAAINYHQLDKIVVQVKETEQLKTTTQVLQKMLYRRHSKVQDFEITVPELLLKQQQRTKDIFNIVLGAIASISLIVGGIGIMNIMLASVLERVKEIGTRMAIGATRKDISIQFIAEATLISITGGFIGIILGVVFSKLITSFTGILTIISPLSVIIAFGVSVGVGIIFGYLPAKKAAKQDPVVSLRN